MTLSSAKATVFESFFFYLHMEVVEDGLKSRGLRRCDVTYMFNDTSRYLNDIFTIDYPEFEKHIPDIYPTELQLNKANTSDKETSLAKDH